MGPDGDRAARRFERGCRCFAIEREGEIVAYGWLSTGREWIGELAVWIQPAGDEAYIWNCFTLEPHRRRGNYRSLLEGIVRWSGANGLRRLWIGSIDDPAEKADADAGFAPVLQCTVTRIGPLRRLEAQATPGSALAATALERLNLRGSVTIGLASRRVH